MTSEKLKRYFLNFKCLGCCVSRCFLLFICVVFFSLGVVDTEMETFHSISALFHLLLH